MLHIANIDSLNFPSSHYITRQATVLWLWIKTDYVKNIENCSIISYLICGYIQYN